MINLKIKTNGTVRNLTLPYPGQSIPDIIEKNSVVTVSEVTEPESLKYREGHEWNIEEINFLAKRMESFDKREKRQFDAIASQLKPSTGQDLINQTFNLSRYTLISDFSSLTEIGKTHIINRKQAMSFDEMASTDFAKIGKDLIESGKADLREYVFIQLSYELMVFLLISFGVDFIGTQNPKTVFSVNEGERSAVVPLHHDRSDIINSNNGSSTAVRDRLRIAAHVIQFDTHTGLIGFSQPFGKRV